MVIYCVKILVRVRVLSRSNGFDEDDLAQPAENNFIVVPFSNTIRNCEYDDHVLDNAESADECIEIHTFFNQNGQLTKDQQLSLETSTNHAGLYSVKFTKPILKRRYRLNKNKLNKTKTINKRKTSSLVSSAPSSSPSSLSLPSSSSSSSSSSLNTDKTKRRVVKQRSIGSSPMSIFPTIPYLWMLLLSLLHSVTGFSSEDDSDGSAGSAVSSSMGVAAMGVAAMGAAVAARAGDHTERTESDGDEENTDNNVAFNQIGDNLKPGRALGDPVILDEEMVDIDGSPQSSPVANIKNRIIRSANSVKKRAAKRLRQAIKSRGTSNDTPNNSGGSTIINFGVSEVNEEERENSNILASCEEFDTQDEIRQTNNDVDTIVNNEVIDLNDIETSNELERELDEGESSEGIQPDERNIGDDINFGCGIFRTHYDEMLKTAQNREKLAQLDGLMKAIALLILFVYDTKNNISQYINDEAKQNELIEDCNKKRREIGLLMRKTLRNNGHGCYELLVNLGSMFSVVYVMCMVKHYAPIGTRHMPGDEFNFMHLTQCCIACMVKKIPNFLINEREHGIETAKEWSFGGRTEYDYSNKIATVDIIPVLLKKEKTDSGMRQQYQTWAKRFKLPTFYHLMMIPYCFIQLHIIIAYIINPEKIFHVHIASSSVAKYIFNQ